MKTKLFHIVLMLACLLLATKVASAADEKEIIVDMSCNNALVSKLLSQQKDIGLSVKLLPKWIAGDSAQGTKSPIVACLSAEQRKKYVGWTGYRLGDYKMVAVAAPSNGMASLSFDDITKLLRLKKDANASPYQCYLDANSTWTRELLQWKYLTWKTKEGGGRYQFNKSIVACRDASEVIQKVAADSNAVGIYYCGGESVSKNVRVLPVGASADGPFVTLHEGPFLQDDYILSEAVYLYIPPDASLAVRAFCEFALSSEGSAIAEKHGLITPYMQVKAQAAERLKQMQAGLGQRITGIGCDAVRKVMPDLVSEFVKAKAVVQMSYLPYSSDAAAVGAFVAVTAAPGGASSQPISALAVTPSGIGKSDDAQPGAAVPHASSMPHAGQTPATQTASAPAVPVVSAFVAAGGKELLLLDDRMSEAAMKLHAEKWAALGRDEKGRPNGSGPVEYVPAGRAVAVIVNAANKAESLTLDQIKSIFSGEAGSWKMVGGAGVAGGASGKINCFGLGVNDPSTVLFGKEALAVGKFKGVTIKKDAAEVIAAVSMDTDAIGYVDLTAIPATGQSVKVLAIRMSGGRGADGKPTTRDVEPTAANIKNSMYPLSSRIFLYVHPNASDTAKDFAKFIATCGASTSLSTSGSEASPYADTVKSMMETYRKNGLVPLADAAVTRAAKDAMAAAKIKEADTTAKPK